MLLTKRQTLQGDPTPHFLQNRVGLATVYAIPHAQCLKILFRPKL